MTMRLTSLTNARVESTASIVKLQRETQCSRWKRECRIKWKKETRDAEDEETCDHILHL